MFLIEYPIILLIGFIYMFYITLVAYVAHVLRLIEMSLGCYCRSNPYVLKVEGQSAGVER